MCASKITQFWHHLYEYRSSVPQGVRLREETNARARVKDPLSPFLVFFLTGGLARYALVVILSRWRCHPRDAQSARNSRRGLSRADPPPLLALPFQSAVLFVYLLCVPLSVPFPWREAKGRPRMHAPRAVSAISRARSSPAYVITGRSALVDNARALTSCDKISHRRRSFVSVPDVKPRVRCGLFFRVRLTPTTTP